MSGVRGQRKMPKTREAYEILLRAYRNESQNHASAARAAGCTALTAQRTFEKGWPTPEGWAPPIKEKLAREADAVRAAEEARIRAHERAVIEEAEQARARAVEAKTEEEQIIRTGRKEVLQAFGMTLELVPAMRKLAKSVNAAIMDESFKVDPTQAFTFMRHFSGLMQKGLLAAELTIRLSRLDRGQPTMIVEELMNWDPETCEKEIQEAQAALERARAKGIIPAAKQLSAGPVVVQVEHDHASNGTNGAGHG